MVPISTVHSSAKREVKKKRGEGGGKGGREKQ